jgi:hypothetical protein
MNNKNIKVASILLICVFLGVAALSVYRGFIAGAAAGIILVFFFAKALFSNKPDLIAPSEFEMLSDVWSIELMEETTNKKNDLCEKVNSIVNGTDDPGLFYGSLKELLNNITTEPLVLAKDTYGFIQCILCDTDLRLFQVEYSLHKGGNDAPLYITTDSHTADMTAKLFESFYLGNAEYQDKVKWAAEN